MKTLIQNGYVLDPESKREGKFDVLIEDEKIIKVAEQITAHADKVLDASGCYVMPGFIDLHVHLRDPGLEYKETLETGGKAAARGGVTTICAMPNTKPVVDNGEKVEDVHNRAKTDSPVHVIQIGAITIGQQGQELADRLKSSLGLDNVKIQSIGPIIGLHVGPGSIGVAYHY